MQPTYVVSSNIDCAGYDHGTMFIRFKSGSVYEYAKVPYAVFSALLAAESCGQFFHRFVKSAYNFERLNFDPFLKEAA